jgi:hypothetical protein
MSLLTNELEPQTISLFFWKSFVLVFVASVIFISIIAVYFYTHTMRSEILDSAPPVEDVSFGGTLFLTLSALDSNGIEHIVPTLIGVEESVLVTQPLAYIRGEKIATAQFAFSEDLSYATFLGFPLKIDSDVLSMSEGWNVYRAPIFGEKTHEAVSSAIMNTSVGFASDAEDFYREAPSISTRGDMLFYSLSQQKFQEASSSPAMTSPADWNIYLITGNNQKIRLIEGVRPKWVDANRFAFLKSDGVYLYNVLNNTVNQVYKSPVPVSSIAGFDVSETSNHFALSIPEKNQLLIVPVVNWESGVFKPVRVLNTVATYPTFSSDGNSVAFLAAKVDEQTKERGAEIRFYSITGKDYFNTIVPINSQEIIGVYLTDWQ